MKVHCIGTPRPRLKTVFYLRWQIEYAERSINVNGMIMRDACIK